MKKFLAAFVFLLIAGIGVFAALTWKAAQGESAASLEEQYVTSADRFVTIAGARVRVREEGDPAAAPVLLIHGFTHSLETWDEWASALKNDYRVIRYDLLGHGLTGPDPKERYAPEERAAFIGEVMKALDLDSATIAGNSLGGLAAWRFASKHPDQVNSLILISPGAFPLNGVSEMPAEIPCCDESLSLDRAGGRCARKRRTDLLR